jgi:hypothetical protein
LLGLPQDPTDADDVHEALALIDLDERHWAAGRVEYGKATKGALRKVLSALWRLEQAYAEPKGADQAQNPAQAWRLWSIVEGQVPAKAARDVASLR